MIEDKGLLSVVQRLVVDDDFRKRFATMPKEALMAELGVSEEAYSTLAALVPALLAGGLLVLGDGPSPGSGAPGRVFPEWGKW